jgi:3-phenylpropionate/cinnamic acid dioxygenase small subunit
MPLPDTTGVVHTDLQYVADRQAIVNLVTAYSYLFDEQRYDEWFDLFSDDVVFESTVPCFGTVRAIGKKAFKAFTYARYRAPGSEKNTVMRRHFQGNVHVANQTADRAEVRIYMMITAAPADGRFTPITSGTYSAVVEKRKGRWVITRWYVEVDAPVRESAIPENVSSKEMVFIRDDRKECLK